MSKKIKIAYGSDLHLEFNPLPPNFKFPNADYLIINGDVVVLKALRKEANDSSSRSLKKQMIKFFKEASKYKQIFYIFGNHEYYGSVFNQCKQILNDFLYENNINNVTIMDNTAYRIREDDTVIIGTTLWTDMNKNSPLTHLYVGQHMNDFRIIKKNSFGDPWTTMDSYESFRESSEYIFQESKKYKNVIVATHHAPLYDCNENDRYHDMEMRGGYCSDLSWLMTERPNISYWFWGHTHYNAEFDIGQTKVISNSRGYPAFTGYGTHGYDKWKFKVIEV